MDNKIRNFFNEIKDKLDKDIDNEVSIFWEAFKDTGDRGFAIVIGTIIDNLLEKLISVVLLDDKGKKQLFKEEKILGTALAKIKIAYFMGVIPQFLYNDLIRVNNIRNKFAHEIKGDLNFDSDNIKNLVDECLLSYDPVPEIKSTRMRYVLIVTQIVGYLEMIYEMVKRLKNKKIVDILNLNKIDYASRQLTKEELIKVLKDKK